ncbi:hypothetical protein THAOC_28107, partial [Thalassiosira oceanica]
EWLGWCLRLSLAALLRWLLLAAMTPDDTQSMTLCCSVLSYGRSVNKPWHPDHEQAVIHAWVVLPRRRVREARLCATGVVVVVVQTRSSSPRETPSVSSELPAESKTQTGDRRRFLSDGGSELQRMQNSALQVQEKEWDQVEPH